MDTAQFQALSERMGVLERMIRQLVEQKTVKEFYTTHEVAELVGKAEFTVREWCRLGRIRAEKRACGRGTAREWMISHHELERLRNHGLLPCGTTPKR